MCGTPLVDPLAEALKRFIEKKIEEIYHVTKANFGNRFLCLSEVTANLVRLKYRQLANVIRVLHLNQPKVIQDVEVVLVDANHCPGSVMFVFRFPTGRTVLHVGDFRADASMEADAQLSLRPIDTLYLDTTYCDEYYKLPPQKDVLEYVRQLVRE